MRSGPLFALCLCSTALLPSLAGAGFPGFESRGFPPERPNGVTPEEEPVPRLKAYRVDGDPIRIDGMLDEETWSNAEAGHGFPG